MIQKFKSAVLVVAMALAAGAPALLPATASAAADINKSLCSGTNIDITGSSSGNCTPDTNTSAINDLLTNVINIFSIIVGVIAVIMIIVGGLRYITSGGESNKVGGAKNTIIYAIVGLVIVALAQFIVHFILGQTNKIVQ